MAGWTLDDIPWQAFDRARVDPAIIPVIKAASMVEANAAADHVRNAIGLVFTTVGFDGAGPLGRVAAAVAWRAVRQRRSWLAHRPGA